MSQRSSLTHHKNRLPDDLLEAISAGAIRRGSVVLMFAHSSCAECERYLEALSSQQAELASWDAQLAIVHEPEARFSEVTGIAAPGIVIVDQWQDIKDARAAGQDHAFPTIPEIISWARYLATQCPECEGETL